MKAQISVILNDADDTIKVQKLLEIGYEYEFTDPDSALIIYELAGNLSQKLDYPIGTGKSMNYSGIVLFEKGQYAKAQHLYLSSIEEFKKVGYLRGIAANHNNLGNIYLYYKDLDRCIEQYLKSVTIFEDINDTVSIINAYNNIGTILYSNKQYRKSLGYLEEAKNLSLKTADSSFITDTYLNISNSYYKLGDTLNGDKYINLALNNVEPESDMYIAIMVYNTYSDYLIDKGLKVEALKYAKLSFDLARKTQNPYNICAALLHMGEKSMLNKQQSKAEEYLNQAVQISIDNNLTELLEHAHINLSKLYESRGDYKSAYHEVIRSNKIRDVLNQKDREQIIQELETKYQTMKKEQLIAEKDIKITNQKMTIIWIIITVSGIVFTLLLGLSYIQLKRKILINQLQHVETEKEIQNMKYLIDGEEKERLRLARELHDGVNGSLGAIKLLASAEASKSADTSGKWSKIFSMIDQVSNEVREISHNLMPDVIIRLGLQEAVRGYIRKLNNNNIDFDLQFYGNIELIDNSLKITMYRIVQELSRNIIAHSHATECIIQLNKHEDSVSLSVEDNGTGFNVNEIRESKASGGIGLHSIYSRIELLGGKIDIQSEKNSGTSFQIELPLNPV